MKKTNGLLVLILLILATVSQADILMFTHEGKGSGTLAGSSFPMSDFIITSFVDTDDREQRSDHVWSINHISASISINGLGDFEFLTSTRTFVNNSSQAVGFSHAGESHHDLFHSSEGEPFATWDMLSPVGPTSAMFNVLMQWDLTPLVETTGGILIFDDNYRDYMSTFTATIPEPAALLLLGLGGLALRLRSGQALRHKIRR